MRSMKRTPSAIALIAAAGLTISACVPPNENPSDTKVDTATEQDQDTIGSADSQQTTAAETEAQDQDQATADPAAEGDVMVIDCFGTPQTEPTALSADCQNPDQQITDIQWDEWTEESATGTGTGPDGEEAQIELSEPTNNGTAMVFSVVLVDGAPVDA
ncbi:hypothetical protein C3B44_07585 [Corynebacterium yudongzhengii]|uniref:Secreted protein n=1 Tax=Corynebacterium yudongzhengii TaxID=2080740 RepID=A0A2U1T6T0_9CORY|nr:hypothetical protein [Corynebacterium yudongzhengii]AWB82234.1 hypothetical protein C3B44_07585 [Corynebacterium yudongzhengii]PWC01683.1 hypothetical protein DF222_06105 [Corynebacterium yudongzhengii]